jgi:hypothetical protein
LTDGNHTRVRKVFLEIGVRAVVVKSNSSRPILRRV